MYTEVNFIFGLIKILLMLVAFPSIFYGLYLLRKISNK